MLYNVLPPLIFFLSLGGVIVVVSRVIIRIRRQQSAFDLQQQVQHVARRRLSKIQDLAAIIAPNQNSVRRFKTRLSVIQHYFKASIAEIATKVKRRERREGTVLVKDESGLVGESKNYLKQRVTAIRDGNSRLMAFIKGSIQRLVKKSTKNNGHLMPETKEDKTLRVHEPQTKWRQRLEMLGEKSMLMGKGIMRGIKGLINRRWQTIENTLRHQNEEVRQAVAEQPRVAGNDVKAKAALQPLPQMHIVIDEANALVSREKLPIGQIEPSVLSKQMMGKIFKRRGAVGDLTERVQVVLNEGKVSDAEALLVPYLAKHPRDTQAYMLLGEVALRREAWSEAVEIFEQVLRISPTFSKCYASLGRASYESGNLTKAIEFLQRAHDAEPDNVTVIQQLYKIARRMDNLPMQQSLTSELHRLGEKEVV